MTLDTRLDEIDRLATAIEAFCADAALPGEAMAFTLCAEELFTNVVMHGFGGEEGHAVAVTLRREGPGLAIDIEDEGPAFDPTAPVAPDLDAAVEDRAIGGLGRHLVSTLMQDFCYRRVGSRNRVTFGRVAAVDGG